MVFLWLGGLTGCSLRACISGARSQRVRGSRLRATRWDRRFYSHRQVQLGWRGDRSQLFCRHPILGARRWFFSFSIEATQRYRLGRLRHAGDQSNPRLATGYGDVPRPPPGRLGGYAALYPERTLGIHHRKPNNFRICAHSRLRPLPRNDHPSAPVCFPGCALVPRRKQRAQGQAVSKAASRADQQLA